MKSPAFRFVLSIGATAILVFLAPHLDRLWSVEAQSSAKPPPKDNEELIRLYQEDQADRAPRTAIDWKVVGPRDQASQPSQTVYSETIISSLLNGNLQR